MQIDVYHPLVATDHKATCAALCTDWNEAARDNVGCDAGPHSCWCLDGALSFAEFQAKYPDVTVAETKG